MAHNAPSFARIKVTQIFACIFVQNAMLTNSRNYATMNTSKEKRLIKMTVRELIATLLEMPMDAEIVKSYSIEDDEGEEWTVEDPLAFIK